VACVDAEAILTGGPAHTTHVFLPPFLMSSSLSSSSPHVFPPACFWCVQDHLVPDDSPFCFCPGWIFAVFLPLFSMSLPPFSCLSLLVPGVCRTTWCQMIPLRLRGSCWEASCVPHPHMQWQPPHARRCVACVSPSSGYMDTKSVLACYFPSTKPINMLLSCTARHHMCPTPTCGGNHQTSGAARRA
jgi:hypothetical protein